MAVVAWSTLLRRSYLGWLTARRLIYTLLLALYLGAATYGAVKLDERYRASIVLQQQCPLGMRAPGRWNVDYRTWEIDC